MSQSQVSHINFILKSLKQQSEHECLVEILRNPQKTKEDAKELFDKIQDFRFFKDFFDHYIQDMDLHSILSLCQSFQYEKFDADSIVFKQKDLSNDKFYVILSGEVGVVVKSDNLGNFGDLDKDKLPHKEKEKEKKTDESQLNKSQVLPERRLARQKKKTFSVLIHTDRKGVSRSNSRRHLSTFQNMTKNKSDPSNPAVGRAPPKSIFSKRVSHSPDTVTSPNTPLNLFMKADTPQTATGPDVLPEFDLPKRSISELKLMAASSSSFKKFKALVDDVDSIKSGVDDSREANSASSTLQYLEDEDKKNDDTDAKSESIASDEDEDEGSNFRAIAAEYGKVVRVLKRGEGFGEVALKKNIPRTATILCKTTCEFLVMRKKQYELGFWRMQREKEEFLATVFPMLATGGISSTLNYNYLLYSFRTERKPRGTYLVKEGRNLERDPKFYVIQHGECTVEKQLMRNIKDPYDLKKTLMSSNEKMTITVAGRGVVIGEEILFGDKYEYSIKVSSEMAMIQAITKKEFQSRFPKEFQHLIADLYEKKKAHRQQVYEHLKKESDNRAKQHMLDNVYGLKHTDIKNFVTQPALQAFSHHLIRGNKLLENNDPIVADLYSPTTKQVKMDHFERRRGTEPSAIHSAKDIEDLDHKGHRNDEIDRENVLRLARFGIAQNDDTNKQIIAKIKFLERVSSAKTRLNTSNTPVQELRTSHKKVKILRTHQKIASARLPETRINPEELMEMIQTEPDQKVPKKPTIKVTDSYFSTRHHVFEEPVPAPRKSMNIKIHSSVDLKHLYSGTQKVVKGPASLKAMPASLNNLQGSPSLNSIQDPQSRNRLSSYDSTYRDPFVTTLPTEPALGSLNCLQVKSHKETSNSDENQARSLNSLSFLPPESYGAVRSYVTVLKNTERLDSADAVRVRKGSVLQLSSPKESLFKPGAKSRTSIYANLHKADEWRKRIFKKTSRK